MNTITPDPGATAGVPLAPPGAGAGSALRDDEHLLAQLASSMFTALPNAGPAGPNPGASPPGANPGASPAGGGFTGTPLPDATDAPPSFVPSPVATPSLASSDFDVANLELALPTYAHVPNPGDQPPAAVVPPASGGYGRVMSPTETVSVPTANGLTPNSLTPGFGNDDPVGALPPLGLSNPGQGAAPGGGIGALSFGDSGSLYFLDNARAPAAPAPSEPPAFAPAPAASSKAPVAAPSGGFYDIQRVRNDFPILRERVGGKPLVWLDNGATTQKPQAVIDRISYFYEHENSNIHRAAHELAARSTDAYEGARNTVARFLGAPSSDSIVFTRGTTEAINLVAQSWGRQNLKAGDAIVVSNLEHHANIVPWVRLSQELGFEIRVAPVDDHGDIILEEYAKLLNGNVKLASFTQVSNALGTVTPAKIMTELAHAAGALVLLDGAQSVSHMPVDVRALNPDFFVFSGHKIYGPTGIGALYGRKEVLDAMPPWQGGGNMIEDVTFEKIRYHEAPMKFEAGTGNIADAVGLGAALDYVEALGRPAICAHEHMLIDYAERQLRQIPGVKIIGEPMERAGVVSFIMDNHSVPAIGQALSREGIAVRAGHHCAQPILRRMGVEATVRPSFGVYNTMEDIDALVRVVRKL